MKDSSILAIGIGAVTLIFLLMNLYINLTEPQWIKEAQVRVQELNP